MIRLIKIFKVTRERFRLKKEKYKSIFKTRCGLVRLRIEALVIKQSQKSNKGKEIDVVLSHIFS